jgi:hypothetical protein
MWFWVPVCNVASGMIAPDSRNVGLRPNMSAVAVIQPVFAALIHGAGKAHRLALLKPVVSALDLSLRDQNIFLLFCTIVS